MGGGGGGDGGDGVRGRGGENGVRGRRGENGVSMIWCVRRREEVLCGLEILEGRTDGVEVYVTNSNPNHNSNSSYIRDDGAAEQEENIELEQRIGLLRDSHTTQEHEYPHHATGQQENTNLIFHNGRPDLRSIVNDIFETYREGKVAVLVCGPRGLGRAVRNEVGKWVGRGREVWWHGEEFGW